MYEPGQQAGEAGAKRAQCVHADLKSLSPSQLE